MSRPTTPLEYWSTAGSLWMRAAETQSNMAMRMFGMAGQWPVPDPEVSLDKPEAVGRSMMAASLAAVTGKRPDEVLKSAAKTLRKVNRR